MWILIPLACRTLDFIRQRWTPATRAVVFIHLYGQTTDLAPLAEWCQSQGAVLIEDLAQAQCARLPSGQPAGSIGDMAVYSFNRTKILECGGGAFVVAYGAHGGFVRKPSLR